MTVKTRKTRTTTKRITRARKADAASIITKRQAVSQLKKGVCQISFRREDGTTRNMLATLRQQDIPYTLGTPIGGSTRNVVVVWDVDSYGWRSFRIDRLRKLTPNS